jgi:DNA replication and repair protein RecF
VGVEGLTLRDFRCYEQADVALAEGLTVITGPNGAGKTNLLEALYFGCTGRSCRTTNEREIVRFGAGTTRVVVRCEGLDGGHELAVGFTPGEPKHMRVDGAVVERLLDAPARPLVSVFLPDRLELVKGAPALRRAHLDQLVTALWPARAGTRRAYAQSLAQRNALLTRIRAGQASQSGLESWDLQLARHGVALMADRAQAVQTISQAYSALAQELGLEGGASVAYRPRSRAGSPAELAGELAERRAADLDRGFTGHGPHRDDLALSRAQRDLRAYGSQGQQRLGLLTLLLAERDAIASARDTPPLMLLDDVMSELDHLRREALIALLRDGPGQSVITTTDLEHVPGATSSDVHRVSVQAGRVLTPAGAAA